MQLTWDNPFPPECCYTTLAATCSFCFPNSKKLNKSEKALPWIGLCSNKRLRLALSVILLLNMNLQSQAQLERSTVPCGCVPSEHHWNFLLLSSLKARFLKIILCTNGNQSAHRISYSCIWGDYAMEHWFFNILDRKPALVLVGHGRTLKAHLEAWTKVSEVSRI